MGLALQGNYLKHERAVTAVEERGRACCCSTVLAAARNDGSSYMLLQLAEQ